MAATDVLLLAQDLPSSSNLVFNASPRPPDEGRIDVNRKKGKEVAEVEGGLKVGKGIGSDGRGGFFNRRGGQNGRGGFGNFGSYRSPLYRHNNTTGSTNNSNRLNTRSVSQINNNKGFPASNTLLQNNNKTHKSIQENLERPKVTFTNSTISWSDMVSGRRTVNLNSRKTLRYYEPGKIINSNAGVVKS